MSHTGRLRKVSNSPVERSYKVLSTRYTYDRENASVRLLDPSKGTSGYLTPDDFGMVNLYLPENKQRFRMKYNKLCWILGNLEDFPENHKVLHLSLGENDYDLRNLRAIPSKTYNKINEARRNLGGSLSFSRHPVDVYGYVIAYVDGGRAKKETFYDKDIAWRRYCQLQLKYAKILSSYCVSE